AVRYRLSQARMKSMRDCPVRLVVTRPSLAHASRFSLAAAATGSAAMVAHSVTKLARDSPRRRRRYLPSLTHARCRSLYDEFDLSAAVKGRIDGWLTHRATKSMRA